MRSETGSPNGLCCDERRPQVSRATMTGTSVSCRGCSWSLRRWSFWRSSWRGRGGAQQYEAV